MPLRSPVKRVFRRFLDSSPCYRAGGLRRVSSVIEGHDGTVKITYKVFGTPQAGEIALWEPKR